jgi:beta-lactamase regulating signal transducer with metallopeptidase domain
MIESVLSLAISNAAVAALLALIAWIGSRCFRSAQLSYALWLLVLVKLVTPPIVAVDLPTWPLAESTADHRVEPAESTIARAFASDSQVSPEIEPSTRELANAAQVDALTEPSSDDNLGGETGTRLATSAAPASVKSPGVSSIPWRSLVVAVWLFGSLVCVGIATTHCLRFRALLRRTTEASSALGDEVARLAKRMGIRRTPQLRIISARVPPLVWSAWGRPLILIPSELFTDLDASQQRTILAHELAHIRRRDQLVRWLELCVLVLFWWCPVAWWARRRLHEAEEACCDAWVVWTLPDSRQFYGQAISATIEFLSNVEFRAPVLAAGAMGRFALKRRIEMIVNQQSRLGMTWSARAGVLALATLVLPLAAHSDGQQPDPQSGNGANQAAETKQKPAPDPADQAKDAESKQAERPAAEKQKVRKPAQQPSDKVISKIGKVMPRVDVQLASPRPGTIVSIAVAVGDEVEKGQVLTVIRNSDLEIQLQAAQGELEIAAAQLQSAETDLRIAEMEAKIAMTSLKESEALSKRLGRAIADRELAGYKNAVERVQFAKEKAKNDQHTQAVRRDAAERRVRLMKQLIDELTIRAPADGVVVKWTTSIMSPIVAAAPLGRIVGLDEFYVDVYIDESDSFTAGDPVQIQLGSAGLRAPAKIQFISPISDVAGQRRVRIAPDRTAKNYDQLRPGQDVRVLLPAPKNK